MTTKITDGDLLFVQYPRALAGNCDDVKEKIKLWLASKDLKNTVAMIVFTNVDEIKFTVLSVNDVFQDTVLGNK